MFANTADFKTILKRPNIEPIQIIDFINAAVFLYDKVVNTYDRVHKVKFLYMFLNFNIRISLSCWTWQIETKADGSYMVVAGIDQNEPEDKKHSDRHSDTTSMLSQKTNVFFHILIFLNLYVEYEWK